MKRRLTWTNLLRNERGLTLIELLAVLLIGAMLLALAMSMLFMTMRVNAVQTEKNRMQQEANIILANLANHHRDAECYRLSLNTSETLMIAGCDVGAVAKPISDSTFRYEFQANAVEIRPKDGDLALTLTVKSPDAERQNINVKVETTLSRMKTIN